MPRLLSALLLALVTTAVQAEDGRDDYDLDNDGLIEINDLADLNEIRNNLDGSSLYGSSAGCPADGCVGFELTADLDFDTNGDGVMDEQDAYWNGGEGWEPVAYEWYNDFTAWFDGNGHVIRNLYIDRPRSYSEEGFFSSTEGAEIRDIGLTGRLMRVSGYNTVGGLIGGADDTVIEGVFSTGSVRGNDGTVGGLVGYVADGTSIRYSYASGSVISVDGSNVGGLVGYLRNSEVHSSYSTDFVEGLDDVGGLVGDGYRATVSTSHWAEDVSGQSDSDGGVGALLSELRCPQAAGNTTCAGSVLYENWDQAEDFEGNAYWDFGSNKQLPALVLSGNTYRDSDGDGVLDADDEFPLDPAAARDPDGDGAVDAWRPSCDANCRDASGWVLDQFPDNPAASVDQDLDGQPDEWNDGCDSTCQEESGLTLDDHPGDSDNDGVADSEHPHHDGLIDIASLEELHAVRYALNGKGQRMSADGELDVSGCPAVVYEGVLQRRCRGYELVEDLDFDTNGDGVMDEQDAYWSGGEGWEPIGESRNELTAEFDGNGHVINNLYINRPSSRYQGLFGRTQGAVIRHTGLTGRLMRVSGNGYVGGLVGLADNTVIEAVFSAGPVQGNWDHVGGLVGEAADESSIRYSFASGSVTADGETAGGLVGSLASRSEVHSSYSTGRVEGSDDVGGLVGYSSSSATVSSSHWAEDVSGQSDSDGGVGALLSELQCPESASDTDCAESVLYEDWEQGTDAEGNAYWDFGNEQQLPALVLAGNTYRDSDGDGVLDIDDEFPLVLAASKDTDGDGAVDAWHPSCDSNCKDDSSLTLDQFPDNPAASVDQDLDGQPDEWSDGCDSTCQEESGLTLDDHPGDSDNDGVADSEHPHHDGLIDIASLEELHAVRYALNGKGQRMSADGELDVSGCPAVVYEGVLQRRCRGYELVENLDFDTNGDGVMDEQDAYWNGGEGWEPIGESGNEFTAVFEGNGHVIRNLYIDRPDTYNTGRGLFGRTRGAVIRRMGLTGRLMSVTGRRNVGGLVGSARGTTSIEGVFSTGTIRTFDSDVYGNPVGGLVGLASDETSIQYSFASGLVAIGNSPAGGLVGILNGEVHSSYATGRVEGYSSRSVGGLVGTADGTVTSSHWAVDSSGQPDSDGGVGALLSELRCPQSAGDTTCADSALYENWDQAEDPEGNAYWDFGDEQQMPGLVLAGNTYRDSDGDGVLDSEDDLPLNASASVDADDDGLPDAWHDDCDTECREASGLTLDEHLNDTDNDGVENDDDAFPDNPAASVDDDDDGLPDAWHDGCDAECREASGLILDEHLNDTDNDGVTNDEDDFPELAEASVDTDGDGKPDAWNEGCDEACQSASELTLDADNDGDGVANDADAFPQLAAASVDADDDGLPDAWHDDCDAECREASGLTLDEHLNDTDNDGVVNSDDAYPNDLDRWEDDQAPEMVEVPEPMKVAATGETTLVSLRTQDLLGRDGFDSEVDYEVSLAGEVLELDADNRVELPSGDLTLQWRAVDDAGNRSEPMAQSVKVYPLVRFTRAEDITGENREARIALSLSGPSPDYPIDVNAAWVEDDSTATAEDLVTEGEEGIDLTEVTLVIDSAETLDEAALVIPVAGDDGFEADERLTLELQSARAGEDEETFDMPLDEERRLHELTITNENLAPTLSLTVLQGGEPVEVVDPEAGEVTIEAVIDDPNGDDEHSLEWQTDSLPVSPGGATEFRFDPVDLDEGDYQVSATASDDGNPVLSSESVTAEWTVEATDSNEDSDSEEEEETDEQTGGTEEESDNDSDETDSSDNNAGTPSSGGGSGGGGGQVSVWLLMALLLVGLGRQGRARRALVR